jgi:hypothetical protein
MPENSLKVVKPQRWTGRILGTPVSLVLVFAIGEGVPNPSMLSLPERGMFIAWGVCLLGYFVAWRGEAAGAAMILGGMSAFYVMNSIGSGKIPGGIFPLFFLPGVLFLVCWIFDNKA